MVTGAITTDWEARIPHSLAFNPAGESYLRLLNDSGCDKAASLTDSSQAGIWAAVSDKLQQAQTSPNFQIHLNNFVVMMCLPSLNLFRHAASVPTSEHTYIPFCERSVRMNIQEIVVNFANWTFSALCSKRLPKGSDSYVILPIYNFLKI